MKAQILLLLDSTFDQYCIFVWLSIFNTLIFNLLSGGCGKGTEWINVHGGRERDEHHVPLSRCMAPHPQQKRFVKVVDVCLLQTGKYSPTFHFYPFFPCCQQVNLRLGEFQCLKSSLFKHNSAWRIHDGAKLLASVEGWKLPGAKITQYTACVLHRIFSPRLLNEISLINLRYFINYFKE